jgi:hypothetical protein
MIVFVQPFGLHSPGGGPRILRALLTDAPSPFLSVCTSPESPPPTGLGREVHLPVRPHCGRLESTRLAPRLYPLERLYARGMPRRIAQLCEEAGATGIHGVAHSMDYWYAYRAARHLGIPYYLSVHDDLAYALRNRPELDEGMSHMPEVWNGARHRFVISEAMGREYCSRYGQQPYSLITDGLESVPAQPAARPPGRLCVYFMGLFHLSYTPNMRALSKALLLAAQTRPDLAVSLVCRSGALPGDAKEPALPVEELPFGSEADVQNDLNRATVLYMPLPFTPEHDSFVRLSLSTKMITYLGSGLPILYHGPGHAAAGQVLQAHDAAFLITSLEPREIADNMLSALDQTQSIAENALHLARDQYLLTDQRNRFWRAMQSEGVPSVMTASSL